MRTLRLLLAAAFLIPVSVPFAHADAPHAKAKHTWRKPRPQPDPDCVPINGRYGYYGNPWCQPESIRPPYTGFRERKYAR